MSEPRTEAGKRLLAMFDGPTAFLDGIIAIEDEAASLGPDLLAGLDAETYDPNDDKWHDGFAHGWNSLLDKVRQRLAAEQRLREGKDIPALDVSPLFSAADPAKKYSFSTQPSNVREHATPRTEASEPCKRHGFTHCRGALCEHEHLLATPRTDTE